MCGKNHATCQLFDVVQAHFQQAIDKGLIQSSIRVPRTTRQLDGRRQVREHVDFPRRPLCRRLAKDLKDFRSRLTLTLLTNLMAIFCSRPLIALLNDV